MFHRLKAVVFVIAMSGGSRNTTPSREIRGACLHPCSRAITRPASAGREHGRL